MNGTWYVRRGRISRKTYWLHYSLPLTGAYILAAVLDISLGLAWYTTSYGGSSGYGYSYDYYSTSASVMFIGGPITLITSLALITPSISALVTRLHDGNHSAHWLWFTLLPIAGPIILLITAGFLPGTPGPNNYGYPEGAVPPANRHPSWKRPTTV